MSNRATLDGQNIEFSIETAFLIQSSKIDAADLSPLHDRGVGAHHLAVLADGIDAGLAHNGGCCCATHSVLSGPSLVDSSNSRRLARCTLYRTLANLAARWGVDSQRDIGPGCSQISAANWARNPRACAHCDLHGSVVHAPFLNSASSTHTQLESIEPSSHHFPPLVHAAAQLPCRPNLSPRTDGEPDS